MGATICAAIISVPNQTMMRNGGSTCRARKRSRGFPVSSLLKKPRTHLSSTQARTIRRTANEYFAGRDLRQHFCFFLHAYRVPQIRFTRRSTSFVNRVASGLTRNPGCSGSCSMSPRASIRSIRLRLYSLALAKHFGDFLLGQRAMFLNRHQSKVIFLLQLAAELGERGLERLADLQCLGFDAVESS